MARCLKVLYFHVLGGVDYFLFHDIMCKVTSANAARFRAGLVIILIVKVMFPPLYYFHSLEQQKCIDSRPRVGTPCQKRSRSGLCSKLSDMRSVGDIALNMSTKREQMSTFFTVSH